MSSTYRGEHSPRPEKPPQTRSVDPSLRASRRDFLRAGSVGLASAVLLGAAAPVYARSRGVQAPAGRLRAEVEEAAGEYAVPVPLLLAMGYVNTRLEMPPPEASDYREGDLSGRGAYGIMALVRNPFSDTLGTASELTGIPAERLKRDRAANILGGAAVLASSQGDDRPADAARWMGAVQGRGGYGPRYSATSGTGAGDLYAGQVEDALHHGFSVRTTSGERVVLPGRSSR